jgi:septal ring factor EnvC (AmiA/AmiB activator)
VRVCVCVIAFSLRVCQLFCKARPLLKRRNIEKEIEERDRAINELKAQLQRESDAKGKLDTTVRDLQSRLDQLQQALSDAKAEAASQSEARLGLARDNSSLQVCTHMRVRACQCV